MHQFVLDEVTDQDPDHPDGEVQPGGEFGDRLGHVAAQFDDLHVFRGERLVPAGIVGRRFGDDDRDQVETMTGRAAGTPRVIA